MRLTGSRNNDRHEYRRAEHCTAPRKSATWLRHSGQTRHLRTLEDLISTHGYLLPDCSQRVIDQREDDPECSPWIVSRGRQSKGGTDRSIGISQGRHHAPLKPDRPVLWRRPAAIETQATKAKIIVERTSRPHQRDIGSRRRRHELSAIGSAHSAPKRTQIAVK